MYCVGQGSGLARCCAGEEKVWKEAFRADTKMAVDGREMLAARFQGFGGCSVEEAPAASEYTKMGGCVGLRLSRVTWSYVLAESPFSILHSPSGLPTGIGHRGFTRSEGQNQIQEANLLLHCFLLYTRHSHVWPRLIFAQDFPGHNDRYRSNLPGQPSRPSKAAAATLPWQPGTP